MRISNALLAGFMLSWAAGPVWAADDTIIQRLALCQDSWLDMQKGDPAQLKTTGDHLRAVFAPPNGDEPFVLPNTNLTIAGMRITQAFPNSVGMGVGFSATVAAPFDVARKNVESVMGKKLPHCEASDGMKSCELQIAEKRTVMLMAADPPDKNGTLIGCYYFYEK